MKENGRALAQATAPGDDRRLGLAIDDARHHLHVIGPTGTGKSTLLARLICADIAAGRGVVVVEPKGDLVEEVLKRIPPNRVDQVVVLDPTETNYPIGLNPLLGNGRSPELVADQVLAVFHGLWRNNWGPRLQDILHASLLTLAIRGDASLCALPALLTNPAVRRRLRAGVDDPIALEPFWAWFETISDAERQQAIAPVLNKLRPFLLRKSMRAIVGQLEPRFRIDEVFTERKIVLVSLAKGLIGPEASALLGSLFVAELWQAVLGRGRISAERRHPVVAYADEFQDYVHLPTDMADALAQARSYGVGLTLAHQHLAQLPGNLRAAVLANARSRVCFQLAGEDAQAMARFSGGLLQPIDFQRLRRYETYVQLVVEGEVTEFASARTLPLPAPSSDSGLVRESSRRRYGRPVDEVDAEIRQLIEGEPGDERVGRRGRQQR
ncbi:MAG: type IV secretory system conjugative DNA transfer family protein [Gaiellaceae bacterium]